MVQGMTDLRLGQRAGASLGGPCKHVKAASLVKEQGILRRLLAWSPCEKSAGLPVKSWLEAVFTGGHLLTVSSHGTRDKRPLWDLFHKEASPPKGPITSLKPSPWREEFQFGSLWGHKLRVWQGQEWLRWDQVSKKAGGKRRFLTIYALEFRNCLLIVFCCMCYVIEFSSNYFAEKASHI